jgi:CheY-like chemotaxis protein
MEQPFLRDIRRDPELKFTQVVLMTGSPDLATPCKDVEELVADDFLVKPVDLQTLLSCGPTLLQPPVK